MPNPTRLPSAHQPRQKLVTQIQEWGVLTLALVGAITLGCLGVPQVHGAPRHETAPRKAVTGQDALQQALDWLDVNELNKAHQAIQKAVNGVA